MTPRIGLMVMMVYAATFLFAPVVQEFWVPRDSVEKWSRYYDVRADVVQKMIEIESAGWEHCVERMGGREISFGKCQISPETLEMFESKEGTKLHGSTAKKKLFDGDQNVRVGCWQLSENLRFYRGDYRCALSAYNVGNTGLQKYRDKTGKRFYAPYIELYERRGLRF